MMDFKEFVNQMEQDIQTELSKKIPGVTTSQHEVEKLQVKSYTAVSVTREVII